MKRKREVVVGRFRVRSDGGKEYTIIEYQEYVSAGTLRNPNAEIAGLKRFATSGGGPVNYIDAETFKVVSTNEVVRKV